MLKKLSLHILTLLFCLSIGYSQSREEASFIKRWYHDLTARYNGYFYAQLKYTQSLKQLKEQYQYNYEEQLPIFPYIDAQQTTSFSSKMDVIIQKTSKVIKIHKISKWADNCYFLMGKAYFWKKDYEEALKAFVYITTEYKTEDPKPERYLSEKEKNQRERQKWMKEHKFKHRPVYFEAALWLIHTHIAMGNYEKAQTVINLMREKKHFPERLTSEMAAMQAHLYLKSKKKRKAIPPLKKAIQNTENRDKKARYSFILAQIYQSLNQSEKAVSYYSDVIKYRPTYEMTFQAKLNMAKTYEEGGDVTFHSIKTQLKELANDDKNIDYLDQIYYLLGKVNLKQGRKEKAIQYLNKSLRHGDDQQQKGLAYQQLAQIYFDDKNYEQAKYYYDSTYTAINKDFPHYQAVKDRKEILDDLVSNLKTIEREDSLQELAALSPKERSKAINRIIAQKEAALRRKRQKEEQKKKQQARTTTPKQQGFGTLTANRNNDTWYFYNEDIKKQGSKTFQQKWGERSLEDNWRRSQKSSEIAQQKEDTTGSPQQAVISREEIQEDIPTTEKQMKASNQRMIEALYENGLLFRARLKNYQRAEKSFQNLNDRFGRHQYHAPALYNLYAIHQKLNEPVKAEEYKQKLLNLYPNSDLAKTLKRPKYAHQQDTNGTSKIERFYNRTYRAYQQNRYHHVINASQQADSLFNDTLYNPRIQFLAALSHGKQKNYTILKTELEKIIENYPEHQLAAKAKSILNHYRQEEVTMQDVLQDSTSIYAYSPREEHYFVTVLPTSFGQKNRLNIILSDFNKKEFRLKDLKVSNMMLNKKKHLVMVKGLPDKKKALQYYSRLQKHKKFMNKINPETTDLFVMSKNNFQTFYKDKGVQNYQAFFNKHYQNNPKSADK